MEQPKDELVHLEMNYLTWRGVLPSLMASEERIRSHLKTVQSNERDLLI